MAMPKATPKARLFQMYPFGRGLTFVTESVPNPPSEDAVPGTTSFFKTNHAVTFRCTLSLPDGSKVVSDLFPRKKDAEHNASQRALDQMSDQLAPTLDVLSVEEKWENLRRRIQETFSDKNVLSYLPLREHFKVAVKRKGSRYGQVPISAVVALDAKINTLCKVIDRKSETDPVYAVAILCKAASICTSVKFDCETLCISRIEPFKPEVEQELLQRKQEVSTEVSESMRQEQVPHLCFRAVLIPSSVDRAVCSSRIVVEPEQYYMDVLAERIGLEDGSRLAMSRPIGKTHPAMRLYGAIPKTLPNVQSPQSDLVYLTGEDPQNIAAEHEDLRRYSMKQQGSQPTYPSKNVRASLPMGYPVYGDVLLAAVGCDWRSMKVYSLDVSLSFYYRLLLGRFPQGNYKVNRGAIMASSLPISFSSRLQWRGMSPRGLLIEFCQQHRLPDPVFVLSYPGSESRGPIDLDGKIPELAEVSELDEANGHKVTEIEKNDEDGHITTGHTGPFFCMVRVEFQRGSVMEFESGGPYRNRHDAIQSCALKAVHSCRPWFESILRGSYEPILPDCRVSSDADEDLPKAENDEVHHGTGCRLQSSDEEFFGVESGVESSQIEQIPPPGAMVTIRYIVRWFRDGCPHVESSSTLLEKQKEFSFELGIGAVIGRLDSMVAEMPVGRKACFFSSLPAFPLLFAAADDVGGEDGSHYPGSGKLKYTVQLLKFVEPPEERMEAALFKPSLSKQRLGCALSIIQKLQAKSLIDLGCGSGSLMEQLLEEQTGLVELVGLDISPKGLVRAAKVLSTKLTEDQPGKERLDTIKLYEGSISEFNPKLQGIDVAVCIEVVEHMDPGPLSMFGITILGKLQPKVLIVSTPNFEYNPILQGLEWDPTTNSLTSTQQSIEDTNTQDRVRTGSHPDSILGSMEKRIRLSDGSSNGRVAQQAVKFRNEDHRFEWTRAEFRAWASKMAEDYKYDVTFDGVGGSGEDDGPGYASQIAIFTRRSSSPRLVELHAESSSNGDGRGENPPHKIVWQWMPVEQRDDAK
ncbi:unnamed protein product [Calypogeia fissa]